MQKLLIVLSFLAISISLSNGRSFPRKFEASRKSIEGSNDIGTPCSTNASNTYLNIALMIDVSTHMSNENLRQMSLNLQSSFGKLTIGNFWDIHTSGFMVVAYADTAKVVANLTQIKTKADLSNALSISSLKQAPLSTSNSAAGIRAAFDLANEVLRDYDSCRNCTVWRNTAYIFIGASSNGIDISGLYHDIYLSYPYDFDSFMSINYNPSDVSLTSIFKNISHFPTGDASDRVYPAYNFVYMDKNTWTDLTHSLTQSVCTCSTFGELSQLVLFNHTTNKWIKYADCYSDDEFQGFGSIPAINLCGEEKEPGGVAITSKTKNDFIEHNNMDQYDYKYYIGLHRNSQKKWVWTDYDGTEFPLGNYAPWAPGFGPDSPGDCVAAYNQNSTQLTFLWETTSCYSDDVLIICQDLACDVDNLGCLNNDPLPPKARRAQLKNKKRQQKDRKMHKIHVKN